MAKHGLTVEEKVANKIANIVNDLTIDLEMVGHYLAYHRNVTYNRIMVVAEAATEAKENMNYGYGQDPLF